MRFVLTLIFSLFIYVAVAQKGGGVVSVKQSVIGSDLNGGKTIFAREYEFYYDITELEPGPDERSAILVIRKDGIGFSRESRLMRFDFVSGEGLWAFPIQNFNMHFSKDVIAYNNNDGIHFFSKETGKKYYTKKKTSGFVEERRNLFITHGAAWSMTEDKALWPLKIASRYGWNVPFYLDDTTAYVVAEGIQKVNLDNGNGWSYSMFTGKEKRGAAVLSSVAAGAMFGLIPAAIAYSESPTAVSHLSSDLLYDSLTHNVFFASKDKLVCLDRNGKLVWEYPFPAGMASSSKLIRYKDRVIVLNKGLGYYNNGVIREGNPFLASVNAADGKEDYFRVFAPDEYVRYYKCSNDTLLVVSSGTLFRFGLQDGAIMASADFKSWKYDIVQADLSGYLLASQGGSYHPIDAPGPYIYLPNSRNSLLRFGNDLKLIDSILDTARWIKLTQQGSLSIAHSKDATLVLQDGKIITRLRISGKTRIMGKYLLIAVKNRLYIVELDTVLR